MSVWRLGALSVVSSRSQHHLRTAGAARWCASQRQKCASIEVPPPTPKAATPNDGHGITYFPGTINVDEGQGIAVDIAEVASASFPLVPQRMTRVSGVVRDSQGKPLAATLLLRTQSEGSMMMRAGRVTFEGAPAGQQSFRVTSRIFRSTCRPRETTRRSRSS